MKQRYLEMSYRRGKPLAAYYYLPRQPNDHSARTAKHEEGILVDYAEDGRPIGLELTSPSLVTLATVNGVLSAIGQDPAAGDELAPLLTTRAAKAVD